MAAKGKLATKGKWQGSESLSVEVHPPTHRWPFRIESMIRKRKPMEPEHDDGYASAAGGVTIES